MRKGWNYPELDDLAKKIAEWRMNKGFETSNANFAEKIALAHSELSEALEEHRVKNPAIIRYAADGKPEGIASEIVDCMIRLFDIYHSITTPPLLSVVMEQKMLYNEGRPYKHGRKY